MWRRNWALRAAWTITQISLLALLLAACAVAEPEPAPATLTLVPATSTFTPTPITPTPTPRNLPRPAEVLTPDAQDGLPSMPAVALPLVQRALADLAERIDVPVDMIRLVRLESVTWHTLDLGCEPATPTRGASAPQIEGFRVILEAGVTSYEYHTDLRGTVRFCEAGESAVSSFDLLLQTDPVAFELVGMGQRRLATQLQLATQQIIMVEIVPYAWPDSSLGCPELERIYPAIEILGYRIVFEAGESRYAFHTDSEQLFPCPAGRERLPS